MSHWRAIGRATAGFSALVGALLAGRPAQANGAFPSASQLLAEPGDPDHLVLRTTFGLLATRDRGASWDWLCETGMQYQDVEPPMALLEGGTILLAVPDGISHSDPTGCNFELATGTEGLVIDLTRVALEPESAIAVSTMGTVAQLWQSDDSGKTFARLGDPIESFIVSSVDAAPSDADVIYLSGLSGTAGVLLRSHDRGRSFETFSVPGTGTAHSPYIALVDSAAADTVYVRLKGTPSELQMTRDGGQSFTSLLTTKVAASGFALSPDGKTALASNSYDGTFRASTDTFEFEKIACGGPSCLSFGPGGLFGCGDNMVDGYVVGRSLDVGATFERVVDLSCVRGPLACGADTSIGSLCPDVWPTIQKQIGATECSPEDKEPYTGCFAGAAGEGTGGAETTGGSGGATAAGGAGGRAVGGAPGTVGGGGPEPGCGCRSAPSGRAGALPSVVLLAWLCRRRREQGRSVRS